MRMSAFSELIEIYKQWGRFSTLEHEALQQENWKKVEFCQSQKESLKETISALTEGCSSEERNSEALKSTLSELISLQKANQQLLQRIRKQTELKRQDLHGAVRNLHRIRSSYGQPARTVWHSYS